MIRYIIEGEDRKWTARVEGRGDLGSYEGDTATDALRALNVAVYWAWVERRNETNKAKKAAFKSMRRHFRTSIGFPQWAPSWRWLKTKRQKALSDRHYDLVQEVAREMDAREPRGTWPELAELVNQRWPANAIDHPTPKL